MNEPLDEDRIRKIRISMESSETGELLEIWQKNDREEFAPEAFEAIRQVLRSRGEQIPAQGEKKPVVTEIKERKSGATTYYNQRISIRLARSAKALSWVMAILLGMFLIVDVINVSQTIAEHAFQVSNLIWSIANWLLPVALCGFLWIVLQGIGEGIFILMDIEKNSRQSM